MHTRASNWRTISEVNFHTVAKKFLSLLVFLHLWLLSDYYCLIAVCATSCGPHGCVDGKVDLCCHKECLGGCFQPGSNKHCYACMNYRSGIDGACVSKCPPGQVIVSRSWTSYFMITCRLRQLFKGDQMNWSTCYWMKNALVYSRVYWAFNWFLGQALVSVVWNWLIVSILIDSLSSFPGWRFRVFSFLWLFWTGSRWQVCHDLPSWLCP